MVVFDDGIVQICRSQEHYDFRAIGQLYSEIDSAMFPAVPVRHPPS